MKFSSVYSGSTNSQHQFFHNSQCDSSSQTMQSCSVYYLSWFKGKPSKFHQITDSQQFLTLNMHAVTAEWSPHPLNRKKPPAEAEPGSVWVRVLVLTVQAGHEVLNYISGDITSPLCPLQRLWCPADRDRKDKHQWRPAWSKLRIKPVRLWTVWESTQNLVMDVSGEQHQLHSESSVLWDRVNKSTSTKIIWNCKCRRFTHLSERFWLPSQPGRFTRVEKFYCREENVPPSLSYIYVSFEPTEQ